MDDQAKMATMIAIELLNRVEDGTKLLAVHKHYPTGWDAVRLGSNLTLGAGFGGCTFYVLVKILIQIQEWLS